MNKSLLIENCNKLTTPVLFLVFNRPEETALVFEQIRKARPCKLYLAADGPRENQKHDEIKVKKVREILNYVDWPCEVKTLFRANNLGCKYAISSAITWFFKNESQGIILEDDCFPDYSFFFYCQWALNEFKNNKNVWHINGNNFAAKENLYTNKVEFVSLAQSWGWATWADRWKHYEPNAFYLSENVSFDKWKLSYIAKLNKLFHVYLLKGGFDSFLFHWQVCVLNNSGLVVSPKLNLISNIGNGNDATHTKGDKRSHLPLQNFSFENLFYNLVLNKNLNKWYEIHMGLNSLLRAIKFILIKLILIKLKNKLLKLNKYIICFFLFNNKKPIVVASTGRAGSTMLTEAIAISFVNSKFPPWLKTYASRFSIEFIDRIKSISNFNAPILKTHDIFSACCTKKAKYLFLYRNPLDSAISANAMMKKNKPIWLENHIYNLSGSGYPQDIFNSDVLNFENQILSWFGAENVLIIEYGDIWNSSDKISEFVGFKVVLPVRLAGNNNHIPLLYNKKLFTNLNETLENRKSNRM